MNGDIHEKATVNDPLLWACEESYSQGILKRTSFRRDARSYVYAQSQS